VSPRTWARLRLLGGLVVMVLLVWRLGTGPFVDGLRTVNATAVVAGLLIGVPTTLCCAWRWSLVARGRGVDLSVREAVVAYYRSQFINTTLPGGVLGDVHRAARHGLGPVAIERVTGQGVQLAITALALLVLPSPVHLPVPVLMAICVVGLALLLRRPLLVLASTLAISGYVATFLVAAHTSGVDSSISHLLPLTLVVLVAMSIPANIAGWGPREGVAAWAFAAAGLGASAGIATAVVYGVMSLVATLPGAVVLLNDHRLGRRARRSAVPVVRKEPVHA
jgi:glycosyltransferase 2 family protein